MTFREAVFWSDADKKNVCNESLCSKEKIVRTMAYYLNEAYKKWSEFADVETQSEQEATNIKDIKSFLSKTGELEEKAKN